MVGNKGPAKAGTASPAPPTPADGPLGGLDAPPAAPAPPPPPDPTVGVTVPPGPGAPPGNPCTVGLKPSGDATVSPLPVCPPDPHQNQIHHPY